jgi:hypothetical protein
VRPRIHHDGGFDSLDELPGHDEPTEGRVLQHDAVFGFVDDAPGQHGPIVEVENLFGGRCVGLASRSTGEQHCKE